MNSFISGKLDFRSRLVVWAIGISFFVMIAALAISAGFRVEIRKGISELTGDIMMTSVHQNWYSESDPVHSEPSYKSRLEEVKGVRSIEPVIYRAGIVKTDDAIKGVLFKGEGDGYGELNVSVPSKFAEEMHLGAGDRITCYFVGEKVKIRKFTISDIYESLLGSDGDLIVKTSFDELQRLNGWEGDQASAIEIRVDRSYAGMEKTKAVSDELAGISLMYSNEEEDPLVSSTAAERYSQLFDWLNLIDHNVIAILALMIIVAGFNMISGLLIMLFRNIGTIGTFKALGMTDKAVSRVYLRVAAGTVLNGMAAGVGAALLFCLVQGTTHLIKLNPESYFVSYVPVHVSAPAVIAVCAIAFAAILLMLTLPCRFISKVDPADTMRAG